MKDNIGYKVTERKGYRNSTEIIIHQTFHPGLVAKTAIDLAARWGMVAGMPDGEDSTGRSRLRLATPSEVVERALETSQKLWDAFEEKGLLVENIPLPKYPVFKKDKD